MPALLVRNGSSKGRIFTLEEGRSYVVGRGQESDIAISDSSISRRHAMIEWRGGCFYLKDLGSRNGTWVNTLPVTDRALEIHDVVALGQVRFLVAADPEAAGEADRTPGTRGHTLALEDHEVSGIFGTSPVTQKLLGDIRRLGSLDTTVFIEGETGTGKELCARALSAMGPRRHFPFVAVNCGSFSESLAESELFGHEKGAFTGADARRTGHFETADGGTLFFDEVGELPLAVQAKLLRVLETQTFRRVGGTEEISVDVRILSATHMDLAKMVSQGGFREDLLHRLHVFTLKVPSLRDRREDIPLLAGNFLEEFCVEQGREPPTLEAEVLSFLQSYRWPGNVRQLRNAMERASILCGPRLTLEDLVALDFTTNYDDEHFQPLREFEQEQVSRHLRRALSLAKGNRSQAARLLGISRATLYEKLKAYGVGHPET
ncbi:MAG: sigma 54-interacting transcriptional regulator [Planctomycetota bacterium]